MIRTVLPCIVIAVMPVVAFATERHHQRPARGPLVERHRAVGSAVPIVAGSNSVKVDAVGQVVTNFNPGQLDDEGRAGGSSR